MEQKSVGKLTQSVQLISLPKAAATPQVATTAEGEGTLGMKFTVFALAFNILGLVAITFGNTAFSGNVPVADLVLGSSLVCLSVSLLRSFKGMQRKFGRFK